MRRRTGRATVVGLVFVLSVSVGCGSADVPDRNDAGSGSPKPVRSSARSVALRSYDVPTSPPVRVGEAAIAVDQGYPSDVWRFDLGAGGPGRLVNPPIPTYFTGLAHLDDAVLLVGLDCSDATMPGPDDEPSCPGGLVVQRYDPVADTWQVLDGDASSSGAFALRAVDSGAGTAIALVRAPGGGHLVEVHGDGAVVDLSMPAGWDLEGGDPDEATSLCPTPGGGLLYQGTTSDVKDRSARAGVYSSGAAGWSDPVPLGAELAAGLGGTTVCTGEGIAVFGYPTGPNDTGPWVVFTDGRWVRSEAPSFPRSTVTVPGLGVFFDSALWTIDVDGRWAQADLVVDGILGGADLGDGSVAALVSGPDGDPHLVVRPYR